MVGIHDNEPLSYSLDYQKSISSPLPFSTKMPFTPDIIYGVDVTNYIITKNTKERFIYAKMNTNSELIWKKELKTTASISTISVTTSNQILIAGTQKGQMFAALIGTSNEIIWELTFGGSGEIYDVTQDENGDFILVGYVDLFQSGETDFFVTKLNVEGENVWEKVLGEPEHLNEKARLIAITPQGQILIVGHRDEKIWMVQLSPDKQSVTWETEIKEANVALIPTCLFMLDDGNVFITNTAKKGEQSNLYMVQANTELMTSAKKWSVQFSLEALVGFNQRQLSVRYKDVNKYYRVSSNLQDVEEIQLYGKYTKGNFVYVLGLNKKGVIGIISEPELKVETEKLNVKIDLNVYQYLIVLVSDKPFDIQDIRDKLSGEKRIISALPEAIGKRLVPYENIQYENDELGASTRLNTQNIVSFFVLLK